MPKKPGNHVLSLGSLNLIAVIVTIELSSCSHMLYFLEIHKSVKYPKVKCTNEYLKFPQGRSKDLDIRPSTSICSMFSVEDSFVSEMQ